MVRSLLLARGGRHKPSRPKDKEKLPKLGDKTLRGVFVDSVQHAGGGWAGDVDVIDVLDLTNAQLIEEVFVTRVSADVIILDKDSKGNITLGATD